MTYRSRERVRKILAHQEADRVPYCAIRDALVVQPIGAMDLPPDHRAFCLEAVIADAVFDAAGIRLRQVPFTPERGRAALTSAQRPDDSS